MAYGIYGISVKPGLAQSGLVKCGQNWSSLRGTGLVTSDLVRFGQVSLELVWSNQIWAVLVHLDLGRLSQLWRGLVGTSLVRSGKVWADQIRSG